MSQDVAAVVQSNLQNTNPTNSQIEFPQFEQRGFFMLAHSVFQDPVLQTLSGDSFRLFLWMSAQAWRYKYSTGLVRAAISYAAQGTGLSEACVSRGLSSLLKAGLITLQQRNYKLGNLWSVCSRASLRKLPIAERPQSEAPKSGYEAPNEQGNQTIRLNEHLTQSQVQIKRLKKTNKKEKDSPGLTCSNKSNQGQAEKIRAFEATFSDDETRTQAIEYYSGQSQIFPSLGPTARAAAIDRWWAAAQENNAASLT